MRTLFAVKIPRAPTCLTALIFLASGRLGTSKSSSMHSWRAPNRCAKSIGLERRWKTRKPEPIREQAYVPGARYAVAGGGRMF